MKTELTQQDIKELKYEKRIGYVFAGIILTFCAFFNLWFFATNCEREWSLLLLRDWLLVLLTDFVILILSLLTTFLINRKINKDLFAGIKIVTTEKIEWKEHRIDYKAGSGVKAPGMKPFSKYIFILNGIAYNVEKELFDSVEKGDLVEIHTAKCSEALLGIKKKK